MVIIVIYCFYIIDIRRDQQNTDTLSIQKYGITTYIRIIHDLGNQLKQ